MQYIYHTAVQLPVYILFHTASVAIGLGIGKYYAYVPVVPVLNLKSEIVNRKVRPVRTSVCVSLS